MYACELFPPMAVFAESLVHANRLERKIKVINKRSDELCPQEYVSGDVVNSYICLVLCNCGQRNWASSPWALG